VHIFLRTSKHKKTNLFAQYFKYISAHFVVLSVATCFGTFFGTSISSFFGTVFVVFGTVFVFFGTAARFSSRRHVFGRVARRVCFSVSALYFSVSALCFSVSVLLYLLYLLLDLFIGF
jgi:hypothetical protein